MPSKIDLLFQQWKALLPTKPSGREYVQGNFEELFGTLKAEGLEFDAAYAFIAKAAKAHNPDSRYVKNAYRKWKHLGHWANEREYEEKWVQEIAQKAETAFFNVYTIETKQENLTITLSKKNPMKDAELMEFEAEDDSLTIE